MVKSLTLKLPDNLPIILLVDDGVRWLDSEYLFSFEFNIIFLFIGEAFGDKEKSRIGTLIWVFNGVFNEQSVGDLVGVLAITFDGVIFTDAGIVVARELEVFWFDSWVLIGVFAGVLIGVLTGVLLKGVLVNGVLFNGVLISDLFGDFFGEFEDNFNGEFIGDFSGELRDFNCELIGDLNGDLIDESLNLDEEFVQLLEFAKNWDELDLLELLLEEEIEDASDVSIVNAMSCLSFFNGEAASRSKVIGL